MLENFFLHQNTFLSGRRYECKLDNDHLSKIVGIYVGQVCVLKEKGVTRSRVYLPVTLTERECSQSIGKIQLLTRALRALGHPALTSIFS
jgi:hypothetical protein